jgi:hypothetical protein
MKEALQHDPRTKKQIKDLIFAFLYDPTIKQLRARLEAIIIKNSALQGSSNLTFVYKGVTYSSIDATLHASRQRLSPLLHDHMDEYLTEAKNLNEVELPYVLGFINSVLNSSCDLQDYLRVLPDAVHRPLLKLVQTCPCRVKSLSNDAVIDLQIRNQKSISLMKQRLVTNLLI